MRILEGKGSWPEAGGGCDGESGELTLSVV